MVRWGILILVIGRENQMDQSVPSSLNAAQMAAAQKLLKLESQLKGGVNWFFWIAGLSVINTVIYLTGGSITFVVGLGITQVIDVVASVIAEEASAGSATILHAIALFLDFVIAGVFVLFGVLGRRRIKWAIVVGMVLYAGDGVLSVVIQDWLGVVFHLLALYGLFRGFQAISQLARLENGLAVGDIATLQSLTPAEPAPAPGKLGKSMLRSSVIVLAIALVIIGSLVVFTLLDR